MASEPAVGAPGAGGGTAVAAVMVVLGAPTLADGTPGPDLKHRLDHCLRLLAAPALGARHAAVIVSGGNPRTYGSAGLHLEADVMADYLEAQGVDPAVVIQEGRAVHTFHNALYSKTLLREKGLLPAPGTHPASASPSTRLEITVVTTDWHVERSMLCFEAVFCDVPGVAFVVEAVPSNPADPDVAARSLKEKRLIDRWIPLCIEEEVGTEDMPPADAAAAAVAAAKAQKPKGK